MRCLTKRTKSEDPSQSLETLTLCTELAMNVEKCTQVERACRSTSKQFIPEPGPLSAKSAVCLLAGKKVSKGIIIIMTDHFYALFVAKPLPEDTSGTFMKRLTMAIKDMAASIARSVSQPIRKRQSMNAFIQGRNPTHVRNVERSLFRIISFRLILESTLGPGRIVVTIADKCSDIYQHEPNIIVRANPE